MTSRETVEHDSVVAGCDEPGAVGRTSTRWERRAGTGLVAVLAATAAVGTAPASAATVDVQVGREDDPEEVFLPATVEITVGDTVRWTWREGTHSVTRAQGPDPFNSTVRETPFLFAHTFTTPGEFRYVCLPHEALGMVGTVRVNAPPASAPPPAQIGEPAPPASVRVADTIAPSIRSLRARGTTFGRPVALRFRLSESARVVGRITLARGARRTVKRFALRGRRGLNRTRLSTRGLGAGRYRLAVTATDAAGNDAAARRIFRLRAR